MSATKIMSIKKLIQKEQKKRRQKKEKVDGIKKKGEKQNKGRQEMRDAILEKQRLVGVLFSWESAL